MVFKLVRTDTAEPCKIQLPVGKHLIGRGKLLDCEDKRVSRKHGELEVDGDKVVIKALHQNPCFITRKGTTETQILKQNCTSDISNGDKFGLLPDSYWYELLHCVDIDNDKDVQKDTSTERLRGNQDNQEDTQSIETEPLNISGGDHNTSEVLDFNLNETVNDAPTSPSLLQNHPQDESSIENERQDTEVDGTEPQVKMEPDSPAKRCHSPGSGSDDVVKKIKKEPEIKQDPDGAQAGPSNDQAGSNSNDQIKDQKQPSPPQPVLRERCMYGANCYRRNPQHKAQFSHPADADWGTGAQAACPYGAACRKPDPRHWRDHSHPAGVTPPSQAPLPPPNHAGNRRRKPKPKKRNISDDDDDDGEDDYNNSPAPGLIVQGKRVRKAVKNTNNWSGSESDKEEDPFGTDESDEWQPSSDMTDSQLYTQDV